MRWLGLVLVVAAVMLVVVAGARPDPPSGVYVPRDVVNYAGNHTTLWGKIAALSHYDVLKTTEPLMCSDGAANFTCLLSKTDIKPIINALRRIGAEPEVKTLNATWVLILYYNYTAGSWQWRNYTATGAWELKWNNQTARIYQTKIKKSLGEMLKIKERISEKFLVKERLKGITLVGVVLDGLVVGTSNGTAGKVHEDAKRRIVDEVRKDDPEVTVEVTYAVPEKAQSRTDRFRPLVGGVQIETQWTTDIGPYGTKCTLGFVGRWGTTPLLTTAWHCIAWTYTDKTQGNAYIYQPLAGDANLVSNRLAATCGYRWESDNKLLVTCDIISMQLSTSYEPKVFRPDTSVTFGQVVKRYCKYDVSTSRQLAKAGITTDVTNGYIRSYNVDVTYTNQQWGSKRFDVVVKYLVSTSINIAPGDSGSPVFTYEGSADRLGAYGIVSGRAMLFDFIFIESYIQNLCDLPYYFDPTG
ncbi:S1 family peptidase [Pyrobaculum sp. 3827-6]|uniref:S1 family peptidase n=1 Tax=Pyrobaculum sp. 3827-6 TaxID=2983604 RepID=UPI0021D9DCE7|nr:S1 family peptidase [Pyrobaculum sp. 3827-6]MCU7788210.1 S1 family peptidase [Pyrobaculum sp. 3827-6]